MPIGYNALSPLLSVRGEAPARPRDTLKVFLNNEQRYMSTLNLAPLKFLAENRWGVHAWPAKPFFAEFNAEVDVLKDLLRDGTTTRVELRAQLERVLNRSCTLNEISEGSVWNSADLRDMKFWLNTLKHHQDPQNNAPLLSETAGFGAVTTDAFRPATCFRPTGKHGVDLSGREYLPAVVSEADFSLN